MTKIFNNKETVLAVVAHPDDEVLGCGGTLARHAEAGDSVHVLILADGESSRPEPGKITKRAACADQARKILGLQSYTLLKFPDNQMDKQPLLEVVREIEKVIGQLNPTIVYTHHTGDLNIDHQITCRAVMTACRPLPESSVNAIYTFETVSSTEWNISHNSDFFSPNHAVDISNTLQKKLNALRCYDHEMRPFPHARSYESVELLAKLRGAQYGLLAVETFQVMRQIIRLEE
jgi:LmbE family N-acetylglucosaminyl deacetylase